MEILIFTVEKLKILMFPRGERTSQNNMNNRCTATKKTWYHQLLYHRSDRDGRLNPAAENSTEQLLTARITNCKDGA